MQTLGVVVTGVNQVEIQTVRLPERQRNQALIETEFSAISPGTELRCLAGRQPDAEPFPFVPGYALVGRVIESDDNAWPAGSRVLCSGSDLDGVGRMWGGHVGHALADTGSLAGIPAEVESANAVLALLAAIPARGLRLAKVLPGERVAIVGLGLLGQFAARLYRQAGAEVTGFDIAPDRVESLQQAGMKAAVIESDLVSAARGQEHPEYSVVVDVTGVPDVLRHCLDLMPVHEWGDEEPMTNRLVIQGSYPDDFSLPYQATFLREPQVILPRHRKLTDVDRVLHAMAAGLDLSDLAGDPLPAQMAPQIYENLASRKRLGGLIKWT